MGLDGYLEIKNQDYISIEDDQRINVGKPLEIFLSNYRDYISEGEMSNKNNWFSQLESHTKTNLRLLAKIYHGEEWNYSKDEYEKYEQDWGPLEIMDQKEFIEYFTELEEMWTPIDKVIEVVKELLNILPVIDSQTYWFKQEDTIPAFQALLNMLMSEQNKGNREVRILFL